VGRHAGHNFVFLGLTQVDCTLNRCFITAQQRVDSNGVGGAIVGDVGEPAIRHR